MRKIEKEEEQLAYDDPDKKVYHLCIVNLVIGKNQRGLSVELYCNRLTLLYSAEILNRRNIA
jgi:hypothetical protein